MQDVEDKQRSWTWDFWLQLHSSHRTVLASRQHTSMFALLQALLQKALLLAADVMPVTLSGHPPA